MVIEIILYNCLIQLLQINYCELSFLQWIMASRHITKEIGSSYFIFFLNLSPIQLTTMSHRDKSLRNKHPSSVMNKLQIESTPSTQDDKGNDELTWFQNNRIVFSATLTSPFMACRLISVSLIVIKHISVKTNVGFAPYLYLNSLSVL